MLLGLLTAREKFIVKQDHWSSICEVAIYVCDELLSSILAARWVTNTLAENKIAKIIQTTISKALRATKLLSFYQNLT